jgi:hypothetical protein
LLCPVVDAPYETKASRIPEARPAALPLGGKSRVPLEIDFSRNWYSVDARYLEAFG